MAPPNAPEPDDHDLLVGYLATAWRFVTPSGRAQRAMVRLGLLAEVPMDARTTPTWTEAGR